MPSPNPRLYFSFGRMWTIAQNTMTEVIRQKFFYIMVIFAAVVLTSSLFLSQFSGVQVDRVKFVKDFSLGAIKIFGVVIAIVGTAQLLHLELENRTIYPVLAKPVFRVEFLLGKYLGMITLIFMTVVLMSLIFAGVLYYTEQSLLLDLRKSSHSMGMALSDSEVTRQLFKTTRDPALLKAIALIFFQFMIVSALSLMIATFATSVIFNVISTVIIYICGHLEALARQNWGGEPSPLGKVVMLVIAFFVPDFDKFNIVDNVVVGTAVPMSFVLQTMGYGLFYTAMTLLLAHLIFQEKEI